MEDIAQWMASNRLKLNPAKTDFMWCSTHRRQHQLSKDHVTFAGSDSQPPSTVRDLGSHTGLGNVIWTSHQSVSQRMLPAASPYKEPRASTADGGRGKSSSQQFSYFQNRLLQYLLAGAPRRPRYQLDRLQSVLDTAARLLWSPWSAPRNTITLNTSCCWTAFTGSRFRNVSSSSCAC